jgi:hypothetical protein
VGESQAQSSIPQFSSTFLYIFDFEFQQGLAAGADERTWRPSVVIQGEELPFSAAGTWGRGSIGGRGGR